MEFETRRHIAAPPARVWAAISDVAHWPEWLDTVDSLDRLDDGPLRVGSRAVIRQPRLPKAEWTVTEVVDGHHFTWESTAPGLRSIGRHVVTPDGDGAQIMLGIKQQGPLGWVVARMWRRLTQDYIEREARCLDELVTGTPAR